MRERVAAAELLDGEVADPAQLADSFREVYWVNRRLGGLASLRRHLARQVDRQLEGTGLTMLDVAGGTGDVALALSRWAGRRGVRMAVTVLENHPQVLALARARADGEPLLQVYEGDARGLPFPDAAFDLAVCNLALHHFSADEAVQVLREMARVARRGWVVSDLERHPVAYAAARVLAWAVWRNPITRHDGPLSVRRAFTAAEARALVEQAGVAAEVRREIPWRLAIVGGAP